MSMVMGTTIITSTRPSYTSVSAIWFCMERLNTFTQPSVEVVRAALDHFDASGFKVAFNAIPALPHPYGYDEAEYAALIQKTITQVEEVLEQYAYRVDGIPVIPFVEEVVDEETGKRRYREGVNPVPGYSNQLRLCFRSGDFSGAQYLAATSMSPLARPEYLEALERIFNSERAQ